LEELPLVRAGLVTEILEAAASIVLRSKTSTSADAEELRELFRCGDGDGRVAGHFDGSMCRGKRPTAVTGDECTSASLALSLEQLGPRGLQLHAQALHARLAVLQVDQRAGQSGFRLFQARIHCTADSPRSPRLTAARIGVQVERRGRAATALLLLPDLFLQIDDASVSMLPRPIECDADDEQEEQQTAVARAERRRRMPLGAVCTITDDMSSFLVRNG